MKPIQTIRLMNALTNFKHFKNDKLINDLRKATLGK